MLLKRQIIDGTFVLLYIQFAPFRNHIVFISPSCFFLRLSTIDTVINARKRTPEIDDPKINMANMMAVLSTAFLLLSVLFTFLFSLASFASCFWSYALVVSVVSPPLLSVVLSVLSLSCFVLFFSVNSWKL